MPELNLNTILLVGLALAIQAVVFIVLRVQHGSRVALGGTIVTTMIAPLFLEVDLGVIVVPWPTISAACILLGFICAGGSLRFRITIPDLAIGGMAVVGFVSDCVVHGDGVWRALTSWGEWMMPYGAGRYAFGSALAIRKVRWPIAAFFIAATATWLIDLCLGFNPIYRLVESMTDWEPPRRASRFGIVRSGGNTEHPIFFSGVLLAMLPILRVAFTRRDEDDPRFWFGALLGIISIPFALLSRAGCAVSLFLSMVFFGWISKTFRYASIAIIVGAVGFSIYSPDTASDLWMKTGGNSDQWQTIVTLNGEVTTHSSTIARVRILDVYGPAAARAGFFGYGTDAVSDFPLNLPHLPESMAMEKFWTVENSYLLMVLRFGFVGLTIFIVMVLSPLVLVLREINWDNRHAMSIIASGSLGVAMLIGTVYPAYEMIFPMLWMMGVTVGLSDPSIRPRNTDSSIRQRNTDPSIRPRNTDPSIQNRNRH